MSGELHVDIYALLGVSQDVSSVIAQKMYWGKVAELRRAEQEGDESARETIAELTAALEILLDDDLRARYDRGEIGPGRSPSTLVATERRRSKRGRALSVIILTGFMVAAGIAALALGASPAAATVVAALSAAPYLWWVRPRSRRGDPFAILQLHSAATTEDIDLSYQTLAVSLVARIHSEPELVVRELDRLDRAYARAMRSVAQEHLEAQRSAPRRAIAAGVGLGVRAGASVASPIGRAIIWALLQVARRLWWSIGRQQHTRRLLQRLLVNVSRAADARARGLFAGSDDPEPSPRPLHDHAAVEATDTRHVTERLSRISARGTALEQRLSAAVSAVAEAIEDKEESPLPVAQRGFALALETPAGTRRIQAGSRPLRIGNGPDADVVVRQIGDGDEPREYGLIWMSRSELVLHANGQGSECLVNGVPVTWARLDHGDHIDIAGLRLRVEVEDTAQQAAAA